MPKWPKCDLFVSYAEADHAWVERYLLDALGQAGVGSTSEVSFVPSTPLLTEFQLVMRGLLFGVDSLVAVTGNHRASLGGAVPG